MLVIDFASQKDISAIQELTYKIWPETYSSILSKEQIEYMLDLMYSKEALRKQMVNEGHQFIIGRINEQPVCFASYAETQSSVWKLHKLYVLKEMQGKNIGRQLIDFILEAIKSKNADRLLLNVNRHNEAKFFYRRLGFKIISEEDIDIGNGYFMNDYIMQLSVLP